MAVLIRVDPECFYALLAICEAFTEGLGTILCIIGAAAACEIESA